MKDINSPPPHGLELLGTVVLNSLCSSFDTYWVNMAAACHLTEKSVIERV